MKAHFILLLVICSLCACGKKAETKSTSSYFISSDEFPEFIAQPGTINIVNFTADWCPPCKQLKPVLAQLAEENPDIVRLAMIDVDTAANLTSRKGVNGIPDTRFFIDGKEVKKMTGAVPKEYLQQVISTLAEELDEPVAEPAAQTPQTPGAKSEPAPRPAEANDLPPGMSRE